MRASPHVHEPIVPAKDGQPPAFVVACLDCTFAHDAHGLDAEDAVKSVTGHDETHHLIARAIDYAAPLYGPSEILGRSVPQEPHPLYTKPGGA